MAYDLNSFENYTRAVAHPGGGVRLVTMTGWYWNVFDWLSADDEWSAEGLINSAFEIAREMELNGTMMHPGDFHAEFTEALRRYLWLRFKIIDYRERGIANDPKIRTY